MRPILGILVTLFATALLIGPAIAMPTEPEGLPRSPQLRKGVDAASLDLLVDLGETPDIATVWVGSWVQSRGWDDLDRRLDESVAHDATPLIHYWYWGDAISPECVRDGCHDPLHDQHLSQEGWNAMTDTLAEKLAEKLDGREAIVVLETEFNKGGIDLPENAPMFDALLVEQADRLHATTGVRVVLGFGSWGENAWENFPRAIEAADMLGVQAMRASTKNDEASYAGVVDDIASDIARLHRLAPHKPTVLTDLALSSHPDARHEQLQAEALRELDSRLPELRTAGLWGIAYRTLDDDPWMDEANYFGLAERHWGLVTDDGDHKPALDAWLALG